MYKYLFITSYATQTSYTTTIHNDIDYDKIKSFIDSIQSTKTFLSYDKTVLIGNKIGKQFNHISNETIKNNLHIFWIE